MDARKPQQENVQHLQTAMKAVGEAIQLDSNGNDRVRLPVAGVTG